MQNNQNNSNAPQSSTREAPVAVTTPGGDIKINTPVAPDDSPLSWIQKSVKTGDFQSTIIHEPVVAPPEIRQEVAPKEESDLNPLEIEVKPAAVREEAPAVEDDAVDPLTPVEVNFKKVRDSYKQTKAELEAVRARQKEVETELENYKTGKKLPDTLQKQEAELARLSVFEKIHSLKTSNEYNKKFIEPLKETDLLLKQAFKDYEIPEEEVDYFRGLRTEAQKNRYLEERFDTLKGLEIKDLVKREGIIFAGMREAEKEPAQALTSLLQESENNRLATAGHKRAISQERIREGWSKSLGRVAADERFKTLRVQEGNPKYNEEVVRPIHSQAAQESAKFFQLLLDAGLPEITPEIAEYVSYANILSHGAGLTLNQLTNSLNHIKTIERNTQRTNAAFRPPIAQGTGLPQQSTGPRPRLDAGAAAAQLTNQVFGGKK